jgi:predicted ATPase
MGGLNEWFAPRWDDKLPLFEPGACQKMSISKEMRKLIGKWERGNGWPKRLEWLEIHGIRGWTGQRVDLTFPLVALVGENGAGKSTILQAIASVYKSGSSHFASDFFPDTPWEATQNAVIRCSIREGDTSTVVSVRKPTTRWRGNRERRDRRVRYVDLRRAAPVSALTGYSKIAKPQHKEIRREAFDAEKLGRFSAIIGRPYSLASHCLSSADSSRWIPVVTLENVQYSGFHQGAGETTLGSLLRVDLPKNGIVLIDELETSLHPRSQRRLVRDLAEACRVEELQIIFTTHSPYVLEELPPQGRIYVLNSPGGKTLITGVSPHFAMTQMDDERHPEADLYVEDDRSQILLEEILAINRVELLRRCKIIPYGAASVGQSLGQMVQGSRFPRPSLVFLDGDQEQATGCILLPGDDAPERVVFETLKEKNWPDIAHRIARSHADLVDAAESAMTLNDHHDWVRVVADKIIVGGNTLWRAMAISWAAHCLKEADGMLIINQIQGIIDV